MREQTTWNPMSHADYDVLKGKDVFSNDGQSVGSIVEILHPAEAMPAARGRHFFLLNPGRTKEWFGGIDQVYLPESAINDVAANRVSLNLTADQVKQRGRDWTKQPAGLQNYRHA